MPTLIFKETEACNSNCIYCDVIARKKPRTVSMERLEKVIQYVNEYLLAHWSDKFNIVWHGGEPLIVGVDFYKKVLELQDRYCPQTKDRIVHDIQSNLTLINQEMIDVLSEMGVRRIGTSYEPYKGIRGFGPTRDSDAYNRKFFQGIELLEKNDITWGFIYVVTRAVLDKPLELFTILTNFCVHGRFQLHPVYSYKNEDNNKVGITPREFADFLGEIFKVWWPNRRRYPDVEPFSSYLKRYTTNGVQGCEDSGRCAYSHIYIGPDGTYSHCGRASDWDVFEVGNIDNMTILEAFSHAYRQQLATRTELLQKTECKGCPYFRICRGGCPLDGWNKTGSVLSKTEWCESRRVFLKNYFEPITGLTLKK